MTTVVSVSTDTTVVKSAAAGPAGTSDFNELVNKPVFPTGAIVGTTDTQTLTNKVVAPTSLIMTGVQQDGMKIGTPTTNAYGWYDLLGAIAVDQNQGKPGFNVYRGNLKGHQFDIGNFVFVEFHITHDYAFGTDLYIHTHWSHNQAGVSGNVTWSFEMSYAKGHGQAPFSNPVTVNVTQAASPTQYMHMIAETTASSAGGIGSKLVTEDIETDGIILVRVSLTGNTTGVAPFLHFVDIHYQSTNIPTKNKAPNFFV